VSDSMFELETGQNSETSPPQACDCGTRPDNDGPRAAKPEVKQASSRLSKPGTFSGHNRSKHCRGPDPGYRKSDPDEQRPPRPRARQLRRAAAMVVGHGETTPRQSWNHQHGHGHGASGWQPTLQRQTVIGLQSCGRAAPESRQPWLAVGGWRTIWLSA
jgi:hypothetical protein